VKDFPITAGHYTKAYPDTTGGYTKVYPDMIKFTFTLYDSRGIIKGGRRFEHIIYIGK
jgi:hypothetical protein